MSNLYDVLGLPRGATQSAIRKAYRKAAMKEHPDRGGDAEVMAKIQHAYDVLSDEGKRAEYDKTGEEPARERDQTIVAIQMILQAYTEILAMDFQPQSIKKALLDRLMNRKVVLHQNHAGLRGKLASFRRSSERIRANGRLGRTMKNVTRDIEKNMGMALDQLASEIMSVEEALKLAIEIEERPAEGGGFGRIVLNDGLLRYAPGGI